MEIKNIPGTVIPQVPKELFRGKKNDDIFAQDRCGKQLKKIVDETKGDKGHEITDAGFLTWHVSFPYPEKGVKDDFMMMSIQFVKRMLIIWIRFQVYALTHLYSPTKILDRFLKEFLDYANMVDSLGRNYILEKRYYSAQGRELMKGIETFLKEVGISVAEDTAWTFIALVDNDTAYYYRLADILSCTDKGRMLNSPAKEISYLMKLFMERENRPRLIQHFGIFAKGIRMALWIPKYRRAFKKAVSEMDFSKLGLDEADRYHVRNMGGYNYFGRTQEDRLKEWPFTQHTLAEIQWRE